MIKLLSTILLILVTLLILNYFQIIRFQNLSSPSVSKKEEKLDTFKENKDDMSTVYNKNKKHADYQELASYIQKTNNGDFMYKDFTMALPPDFNRSSCPPLLNK